MEETANIKVIVRVRPYNRRELEQNQRSIIKVLDERTLLFDPDEDDDEFFFQGMRQNYRDISKRVNKKLSMEFDRVYNTDSQNMQIHKECTETFVDRVLNGFNCSVFVYGATGAGKTFTMLGNDHTFGLTYLTMAALFERMERQKHEQKFDVGVTYLEVYNEQVMNLIKKSAPLKLLEDRDCGVKVNGLQLQPVYNVEECLKILTTGNANRTQHPTDANAESSRSHAIFQVHIRITQISSGQKRTAKFSMIDLAGSERAASTKGSGMRFKEGASINKSLLALGNCINNLADGLKHIPYRDSNLTRILKDSLGGKCQTLMIANVSMSSLTYDDTYNTLKYASRAKKIRVQLKQNVVRSNMPKEYYMRKVNELSAHIERLQQQKLTPDAQLFPLPADPDIKNWQRRIDEVFVGYMDAQQQLIDIRSKMKCLNLHAEILEKAHRLLLNSNLPKYEPVDCMNSKACLRSQIEALEHKLPYWTQKLKEKKQQALSLQQEIVAKNLQLSTVETYFSMKEMERNIVKLRLNNEHSQLVYTEVIQSNEKLRQALSFALSFMNNEANKEDFEKLQNLVFSQSSHYKTGIDSELNKSQKRPLEPEADEFAVSIKNARLCNDDSADNIEENLNPICSVLDNESLDEQHISNQTQIISSPQTCDKTFALGSTQYQQQMVNNLFSNNLLQVPDNNEHLKNVLIKSGKFSQILTKENRRYSVNRINKSPHNVLKKSLTILKNNSNNMKQKPLSSMKSVNQNGKNTQPMVRTNRAQILRCKKET